MSEFFLRGLAQIGGAYAHEVEQAADYISSLEQKLAAAEMKIAELKDKVQEWTLISEKLPESSGDYLVTREIEDYTYTAEVEFNSIVGDFIEEDEVLEGKIIAWKPAPEPYKRKADHE